MKIFFIIILFVFFPLSVDAGRGCCSHHGGVCGCNNYGKETCCDGTTSKSSSCICTPPKINGCTDPKADNYNHQANTDNGSCLYTKTGCTDEKAKNYNSKANKDDGSCIYYVFGCTDQNAINYNPSANTNDGSCIYHENEETKSIIDGNIKQVENKENLDNNTETIIFYLLSAVSIYEVFKKK